MDDSCHSLPLPSPPGVQAQCSGGNGGSWAEPHCHSGRERWWEGGWRCWYYPPGERESGGGGRGGGFADTLTNQLWIRYPSLSHLLPTPLNHFLLPPSLTHSFLPSFLPSLPPPLSSFPLTHSSSPPLPPGDVVLMDGLQLLVEEKEVEESEGLPGASDLPVSGAAASAEELEKNLKTSDILKC